MARTYESIFFFTFRAPYQDGREADVMIDLGDCQFTLQISRDGFVEEEQEFVNLRRSRIEKFRRSLEELGLLSWDYLDFGHPDFFKDLVSYSYDFDPETEEGENCSILEKAIPKDALPKLHKLVEDTIGTTFGTYKFYD